MATLVSVERMEQAKRIYGQAKALLEGTDAEAKARVPAMLEDAKRLKAEAVQLREIESEVDAFDSEIKRTPTREGSKSFNHFGEFVKSAHRAHVGGKADPRLKWFDEEESGSHTREQKDMAEGEGATGGYLVPDEFRAELVQIMGERGIVRP